MDSIFRSPEIAAYAEMYTHAEPELLQTISTETWKNMSCPQMISSRSSGRLLKLLTKISGARKVLELGMFTGYSALCMAEALPADGKLVTCEIDPNLAKIAKAYFAESPHGHKIEVRLGPALNSIASLEFELDLVFIDADKANYPQYYEACLAKLRTGGLIIIDNCLWSGRVLNPSSEEDLAIHKLNELIARDERVENVMLTVRDGLNIVCKL